MLCLTLTGSTLEEDRLQIERNRPWISLAELRLDCLSEAEQAKAAHFPEQVDIPLILTNRRVSDGGKATGSEKARLQTLFDASRGTFAYVDIEGDVKKAELKFKVPGQEGRVDLEADLIAELDVIDPITAEELS